MAINRMSKRGSKRLSLGACQRPKKTKRLKSTEFIFLALLSFVLISAILQFRYYRPSVPVPFENILQQEVASPRIPTTRNESVYTKSSNAPKSWWRGKGKIKNATHPHLGARDWDEQNRPIYQLIVNPSSERLKTSEKKFVDTIRPEILCPNNGDSGIETEIGNEVLSKAKIGIQKYNKRVPGEDGYRKRKSKILCMVYTVDLPEQRANLRAISETWGQKCDGFIAASNATDHSIGAIDLTHKGPEEYGNMWQKVRSMWAYAYDNYLDEFDFFHITGDDTYIAVENLRSFLDGPDVLRLEDGFLDAITRNILQKEKPRFKYKNATKWADRDFYHDVHGLSGRPLWFGVPGRYHGIIPCGGAGYTLNHAALEQFGKKIDTYNADMHDSREDVFMGGFFTDENIILSHPNDRLGGTRYGESAHFSYRGADDPFICPGRRQLIRTYTDLQPAEYLDGISEERSTFHLKCDAKKLRMQGHTIAEEIYRYHAVLYDMCDDKNVMTKNN